MFVSALVPFIFLNKHGRKKIGIKRAESIGAIVIAFILGIVFSLVLYFVGKELYGGTFQNWYEYIGKSYNIPEVISEKDKLILFSIMTSTGMIFSSIG
ncbi:MAG: hypothetical protein AAF363_03485 [Bacteroidota bacterium]